MPGMRVLIVVAVLVVAGLFYWAFSPSVSPPRAPVAEKPPAPVSASGSETGSSGTNEPSESEPVPPVERSEPPAEGSAAPAPTARTEATREQGDPLIGLGMAPATLNEMERAGVPERFKGGVMVTAVHPDSPAAEVALEPGDIIVRAQTTDVQSINALQDFVRGREYTRITIVRDGMMSQVILKPPFVPESERRN